MRLPAWSYLYSVAGWASGICHCWTRLFFVSETQIFPLDPTVTSIGQPKLNWPAPEPEAPNLPRYSPLSLNFWTRLLPSSPTQTVPLASTSIASAWRNWPLAEPLLPTLRMNVPSEVNSDTRLFQSATQTWPSKPIATSLASLICPSPVPFDPTTRMNLALLSNSWTRPL